MCIIPGEMFKKYLFKKKKKKTVAFLMNGIKKYFYVINLALSLSYMSSIRLSCLYYRLSCTVFHKAAGHMINSSSSSKYHP